MMTVFKKTIVGVTTAVLLLVAVIAVVVALMPGTASQLGYAFEVGQTKAAQQRLEVARELSTVFGDVAQEVGPSVVSVSSTKRFTPRVQSRRQPAPQLPEELREFFGDDGLDRFFEIPTPSQGFEQHGLGSGVIISEDGYVLTNNHVISQADDVMVTLSEGRRLKATIVGADPPTDLAVLKIEASDLSPAKWGSTDQIEIGQWVLAIGSPLGLEQTVTVGIVSAKGRANLNISDYEDFIQTDAAINPGNSGGPLVNLRGEVVGINTAIASRTGGYMGIGFAIPSNMARSVIEAILQEGKVERGRIGALIQNLSEDLAESFGYESTAGVLIGDVVPDSPASEAGLQSGDIVVEYDGEPVKMSHELRNLVAATSPGSEVELRIFRDGKYQEVTIQIGRLEGGPAAPAAGARAEVAEELGITAESLTSEIRDQLGLETDATGVLVTRVQRGSVADAAGIQQGDLIVAVGEAKIENLADFRAALTKVDLDEGVRMQLQRQGARRFAFLKRIP
jgi:serine protease Do